MSAKPRGRLVLVAAVAMIASSGFFFLQVRRVRRGMSSTGSGGIGAVSVPPKLAVFPVAPLVETSLLGLDRRRVMYQAGKVQLPSRPSGGDTLFASRKLIRLAELSVEVERYEQAAETVGRVARELSGYVAEVRASETAGKWSGTIVARIPSERFDEALLRLSKLGKTLARSLGTEDATKTAMDLESRIRAKKDAEARMRDVLRNRTAKLADIIEAEGELTKVVEEIEQMEGERRLLEQQVAFSSVTINLSEPRAPLAVVKPSLFLPVREAFQDAGAAMASSVAGLIYTVVVGAPWALLAVLLWSLFRRLRARRQRRAEGSVGATGSG